MSVLSVSKGCSDQTPYVQGQAAPTGVAVDDANVYWTNHADGTLLRCAANGIGTCAGTPTTLATGLDSPTGVAVAVDGAGAGALVYFTEPPKGTVRACPLPDGCAAGTKDIATGQSAPSGVAVDDALLYWANEGDGRVMALVR